MSGSEPQYKSLITCGKYGEPHIPDSLKSHEYISIHLQAHAVVNLIVGKGDVVLVDGVPIASFRVSQNITQSKTADAPFLELNLGRIRASLGSNQLLQVPNSVVGAAFNPDCERRGSTILTTMNRPEDGPFLPRRSFAITYRDSC